MSTLSTVLIWTGVVVAAFAAVRLLFAGDHGEARNVFLRLHFVSLGLVLAAPLVIAGLAVASWSSWHDAAKLVIIGALLFVTGPAAVITAARAAGRTRHG